MALDRFSSLIGNATSFTILAQDDGGATRAFTLRDAVTSTPSDRFRLDATLNETITYAWQSTTSAPVEVQSPTDIEATDDIVRLPVTIQVQGVLTEEPGLDPLGAVTGTISRVSGLTGAFTGQSRPLQLYETLKKIASKRQLVKAVMAEESVSNLMIASITRTKVPTDGDSVPVAITLMEKRIVSTARITQSFDDLDILSNGGSSGVGGAVVGSPTGGNPPLGVG